MVRKVAIAVLLLGSVPAMAQEVIEVERLVIRPIGEDYAPIPMDSGFVFCSIRESGGAIAFSDAETGKPLSDLYWAPLSNGAVGVPALFSASLATPVNEGPAAFTDGGRTICYTRNIALPKKLSNLRGKGGQLGLFFSHLNDGAWQAPEAFAHNRTASAVMHPTFSVTGDTLFFVSDMPGGLGGMDLYRCERSDLGWSEPVNLGSQVNSAFNEVFPRMHANGMLAFSSDRPGGPGSLDIYTTRSKGSGWEVPMLLPAPVNSPSNDHGYVQLRDGFNAMFSSNRDGLDAIYTAKRTVPRFRDCAEQVRNNYCYSFKRRAHAATSTIPVDHYWHMGDGTRVKGYSASHCYAVPGTYSVRSLLVDRKSGEIFHALSSNDLTIGDLQQAWIAVQDSVRTGRALELDGMMSHLPGIVPAEYHWDYGDGTTGGGLRQQHTYKAPGVYQVKLDVLSVPDAQGTITNKCNTRTVVVIDRFRDHEDISVTATYQDAFGKTHTFDYQELPFDPTALEGDALNDVVFAVQLLASKDRIDLDDPRFEQVRKHFRIVERFDPVSRMYTYSVGETGNMDELYQTFRKIKELQFLDAEVFALHVEKLMDLSQMDFATLEELNHRKLRTSAIHFAYNSSALEAGSELVIDQVTELMKQHRELLVVIEAHTDDIGGSAFNVALSQDRAMAVVASLVEKGIDPQRLVPIGHGKNQPIASNRNEAGRSQNRRVEFHITVKGDPKAAQGTLSGMAPARDQRASDR